GGPIEYKMGISIREDFDGDGRSASIRQNNLGAVKLYGQQNPIQAGGRDLIIADSKVRFCVSDLNNDDKKDMLYAKEDGTVYLLINTTDQEPPVFEKEILLKDGDKILNGGPQMVPAIEDRNNDGKKDLVCYKTDDKIRIFLNQGTDMKPVFNGYTEEAVPESEICGGFRSRLTVVDYNNDGMLDIIYGVESYSDHKGRVYVYLQTKEAEK
ncbi:MAG: VCBS repeat-containing protein, partial [Anaerohalosphaera sp.]|nr:VCBS repeat-containing protein [Anaerohalosphaera sp.]